MIALRHKTIFALAAISLTACGVAFVGVYTNLYRLRSAISDVFSSRFSSTSIITSDSPPNRPWPELPGVANSSLGFSKIFAVGLPERTDKRDALTLIAALTGFDIEWIDGVHGESIPDKAVPFGADRKKLWETNLGSWRGHMNVVTRIVEDGLPAALIMEDDMDWDVHLKTQLQSIASGTRSLMSQLLPNLPPLSSIYGDDWDLLWLGHCGELFPETLQENRGLADDNPARLAMSRKYTISRDATVPPLDKLTGLVDFKSYPEYTRWVHFTAAPICSFAYALSQRGARRVLFELSVDGLSGTFDVALSRLCREAIGVWSGVVNVSDTNRAEEMTTAMKCLSVTPPIFFHHRAKGDISRDSDIQGAATGQRNSEVREKGYTENIVFSARSNIRNLLSGLSPESQF